MIDPAPRVVEHFERNSGDVRGRRNDYPRYAGIDVDKRRANDVVVVCQRDLQPELLIERSCVPSHMRRQHGISGSKVRLRWRDIEQWSVKVRRRWGAIEVVYPPNRSALLENLLDAGHRADFSDQHFQRPWRSEGSQPFVEHAFNLLERRFRSDAFSVQEADATYAGLVEPFF